MDDGCHACSERALSALRDVYIPNRGDTFTVCTDCLQLLEDRFGPDSYVTIPNASGGIPYVLLEWVHYSSAKRRRFLQCLRAIDALEIGTRGDLVEYTDIPDGTIARYLVDDTGLKPCVDTSGDVYALTDTGEKALQLDWSRL